MNRPRFNWPVDFTKEEINAHLESCAFCGSEANRFYYSGSPTIGCTNCNAMMGGEEYMGSGTELLEDWNRRPSK